jgi:hypothetical protein
MGSVATRRFQVGSAEGETVNYPVEGNPERVDKIVADQYAARKETAKALNDLIAAASVSLAAGAIAGLFAARRRKAKLATGD